MVELPGLSLPDPLVLLAPNAGDNTYGLLGDNATMANFSTTPVRVVGEGAWTSLSVGLSHVCGVKSDNKAYCWGVNGLRQGGSGGRLFNRAPVEVIGGYRWTSMSSGYRHSCGIQVDGSGWCFGFNIYGEQGNGRKGSPGAGIPDPQQVSGNHTWAIISAGLDHSCGVDTAGKAWCWGAE
jgi:alpha-tubulin suppressor-like RCC1 family protein